MSKKITINDLAIMVKHGFDDMQKQIDRRFDHVDERFDRLEQKIEGHANRLGTTEDNIRVIKNKIKI